jgi:hypothetical protein
MNSDMSNVCKNLMGQPFRCAKEQKKKPHRYSLRPEKNDTAVRIFVTTTLPHKELSFFVIG